LLRSSVFNQLVLSLYFVIWARVSDPGNYGGELLMIFYATLVSNLCDINIFNYLYKFSKTSFLTKLNLSVVVLLLLGSGIAVLLFRNNFKTIELLELIILFLSIFCSNYLYTVLNTKSERKKINQIEYISSSLLLVTVLVCGLTHKLLFFYGYIFYFLFRVVLMGVHVFNIGILKLKIPSLSDVKRYLKESYAVYFEKLLNFGASNVEKIGAEKIFDGLSLGYHFAGQQLGLKSFTLLSQYVARAYPIVFYASGNFRAIFERTVVIYANIAVVFFLLFGELLTNLILGANYVEGIKFYYAQVFFAYIYSINSYQGLKFYYNDRAKFVVLTSSLLLTFNLIILFLGQNLEAFTVLKCLLISSLINGLIIQFISYGMTNEIPFKSKDLICVLILLFVIMFKLVPVQLKLLLWIILVLIYWYEIKGSIKNLKGLNLI
jgi:O-antigen/teichoic acid export membrane protein